MHIARTTVVLLASVVTILGDIQVNINVLKKSYDKDFYSKNYEIKDSTIYRKAPKTGELYPVKREFREDFENVATIRDLIGPQRGWTSFTLQSPKAASVTDYNKLRSQILNKKGDFLDNRLEPSSERAHTGKQSLKALAAAPETGMACTKSSLHTTMMHYVKGDDVWFSAWYYIEKCGEFLTLMDLESTYVRQHPGMRIRLSNGYLDFELAKWRPKSMYRQPKDTRVKFPVEQWVHIKAHLFLSEKEDGIIQLWQNDKLIIDQKGQTLPFAEAVYDDLEIGLSAHSNSPEPAILYVDDMVISNKEID
ncbi:hypothetical protein BVX97_03330 [bacterium E08(2017)]|nr:hypothetical protein BVX97_03330 [bacterium E08(2017)]